MKRCKVDVYTPLITAKVTYRKYYDPDSGKCLLDKCAKLPVTPNALLMDSGHSTLPGYYVTDYIRWKTQNPDDF